MLKTLTAVAATMLAMGSATAQTPGPQSGKPASISFPSFGGIRDFVAAPGSRGIYLQDRRRRWYFASLESRCVGLPFATRIAVKSWGFGSLDRTGTILVDRERCQIRDLVHSGPPPKRTRRR